MSTSSFVGPGNASSSTDPFVLLIKDRAPTVNDINYPVQKRWLDSSTNTEYILLGVSRVFNSSINQRIPSANWASSVSVAGKIQGFEAGANTSGIFPVVSDALGEISLGSSGNTVQVTGIANGIDIDLKAYVVATGLVTGSFAENDNITSVDLTPGTWIVHGMGTSDSGQVCISTESNTFQSPGHVGYGLGGSGGIVINPLITNLLNNATIYLVAGPSFSVGGALTAIKIGQ